MLEIETSNTIGSMGQIGLKTNGSVPDWLCKTFLEQYQHALVPGIAPKHHTHLFSEEAKSDQAAAWIS